MTFEAYLGEDNLTDVGFQFFNLGTPTSDRSEAGVENMGEGWYGVSASVPANTTTIRWDSLVKPEANARETIEGRVKLETPDLSLLPYTIGAMGGF